MKSCDRPGTLYSYGPWKTSGVVSKLPCASGGEVVAVHSSVVARHGFDPTGLPFQMLQKKLKMNGIWNSIRPHAAYDMTQFQCSTGCACAY